MKRRNLLKVLGVGGVIVVTGSACKPMSPKSETLPKLPSDVRSEPMLVDTLVEIGNGLETNPELSKRVQDILRKSQLT